MLALFVGEGMGWGASIEVVALPVARFVRANRLMVLLLVVLLRAVRVLSAMSWLLVPAVRGRRWLTWLNPPPQILYPGVRFLTDAQ